MPRPSTATVTSATRSLRSVLSQAARISLPLLALATIPARAAFDITFNFSANTTAEQQAYFNAAAAYWESQISGYKAGVNLNGITIGANVSYIDGAGGTLGSAGPGGIVNSNGTWYATTGSMNFDSADVANMIANGSFADVVRHEMGHILGIGTLWDDNHLYATGTGQYTGINALNAWRDEFSHPGDNFVPVELGGGAGTANGHWNEGDGGGATGDISKYYGRDFEYELMTGWANSPAYTSMVTLGSLVDMGYTIAIPTDANGDYALTLGRVFSGLTGAHSMTKTTDGLVTLTTAGDFTGGSTLQAGKVVLENAQALGTGPVTIAGGALDVGAVGVTGIGTLTLRSGNLAGTTGVVNASSYIVESGSASAILGGAGTLTKNTGGTVTLSGRNTYTGATAVNAGALILNGGSLGNTAVTVASGAAFGGNGTVGGSVTFNSGSTLLGNTTDALTVNGLITVGAGTRIDFADNTVAGNTYTVLNYTAGAAGLNNLTTAFRGTVDTATVGQVKVTATAAIPLTWKAATDGNWGVVDGKNNFARTTGGASDNFYQGDTLTFDDTATNKAVNLVGRLLPGSITVSNTSGTYTFGGTGEIAGTTGITKSGAGTLDITGSHSFTGKTTINGGVIQIASDAALGAAPTSAAADQLTLAGGTLRAGADLTLATNRGITVTSASTLDTNGHTVNYAGVLAGSGAFTKTGGGSLTLSGANSLSGAVTVNGGTLKLSNFTVSGFAPTMTVGTAGTLILNQSTSNSDVRNITVHGAGASATTGLTLTDSINFYIGGTLQLDTATTTIRHTGSGTAVISTRYDTTTTIKVLTEASGSVIDSGIAIGGPRSGVGNDFGFTVNVASGVNNATGDLRIDGALRQGNDAGSVMYTTGNGSVNLTGASAGYTLGGMSIGGTTSVMFTGSSSLGGGSNSGAISINGGARLIWGTSANQTLSGVISGAGTLTKSGTGSLTLSGTNTLSGAVTVSGGTLVTSNASALGKGNVSVNGATLQIGDGTVNGVTLGAASTLAMDANSTLKLGASDSKITMGTTGTFALTSGMNIDITNVTLGAGSYTLISGTAAGSSVGTWSANNDLVGGDFANFAYSFAKVGNDAVFTVTAVPEPAAYGLLGAGSLALVALVRRRRTRVR